MATITLEIPEELAVRLGPLRDRLPALLSQLLDADPAERKFTLSGTVMTHPVFLELIDFLFARPTAKQVLAHKVSSAVQKRLEEGNVGEVGEKGRRGHHPGQVATNGNEHLPGSRWRRRTPGAARARGSDSRKRPQAWGPTPVNKAGGSACGRRVKRWARQNGRPR